MKTISAALFSSVLFLSTSFAYADPKPLADPDGTGLTSTQLLKAVADKVLPSDKAESVESGEEPIKKRPRLRFKNGPVCMCESGLSEKEIEASRQKKSVADTANETSK